MNAPATRAPRRPLAWLLAPLLLLERTRGRKRIALAIVYAIALLPILALIRWSTALVGLPDVPAPAPPAPRPVAADRDAWPLYTQAAAALDDRSVPDANAPPNPMGRWIEANRGELEDWRRATARPEVRPAPGPPDLGRVNPLVVFGCLDHLSRMALHESTECRNRGDTGGAWSWCLAAERCNRHTVAAGGPMGLLIARRMRPQIVPVVRGWADDPAVDVAALRRALGDLKAAAAIVPPSDADLLRADCRDCLEGVERRRREAEPTLWEVEGDAWYLHLAVPGACELGALPRWLGYYLGREPERSRRVVKLAYTNWIAAAEAGRLDRPAVRAKIDHWARPSPVYFFEPGAGGIGPVALARWCESTHWAGEALGWTWPQFETERRLERNGRDDLVQIVATALYEREHGQPPPSPDALVGPYLDRLPEPMPMIDPSTVPTTRAGGPLGPTR